MQWLNLPSSAEKNFEQSRSVFRVLILFIVGVFLALPIGVRAQVLYGTITGTVTDESGGTVAHALVKVVNAETGFTRQAETNADGIYSFNDLQPGTYTETVSGAGFGGFEQKNIVVSVNNVTRIDPVMKVGQVTMSVEVSDAPPTLQTDKADVNYNISPQQLTELPSTSTTGRNFQSLYRLVPGSTPPAEQNSAASNPQRAQAVNVNGVSNATNTTRIDGAVDAYPWLPYLVAYVPPQDAIESINVVTASFNAEQGSAGGAAINVTIKSGTNKFHGSAYEYNSIKQFNARGYYNTPTVQPILPKNIFNQFGFSGGGPILKDRLFFFADWERTRIRKANSGIISVPTMQIRSGNFSGASMTIFDPNTGDTAGKGKKAFAGNIIPQGRLSTAATTLLALLPAPNLPGEQNNYFGASTYSFDRDDIDFKLTYNPSQSTSLFGHYSASPDTINDPMQFGAAGGGTWDGGQPGAATGLLQNIGLGFTHAFSSRLLLDTSAGYTRQRIGAEADDLKLGNYGVDVLKIPNANNGSDRLYGGIPAMFFSGFYGSIGNPNTGSPFLFRDNQYTGNANLTWIRGTHSFRFGGEYVHAAVNHFQPGSGTGTTPRGGFTFTGGATAQAETGKYNYYNALADYLLGTANVIGKGVQIRNPLTQRYSSFAFYVQDTWQATRNLTVNYGARYEYYPLPVADHYGIFRYDPSRRSTINGVSVGTVLVGGKAGIPTDTGIENHKGMIVPRLGISYRIDDKTVLRTGAGITVDPDNLRNLLNAYPANVVTSVSGANTYVPAGTLATGIPAMTLPNLENGYLPLPTNVATNAVPKDFRRGYIESYNLALQREMPHSLVASVSYVGTHAVRQQSNVNINAAPPGGGNAGRLLNTTYGATTNNTDINELRPFRGSNYNGLQGQVTRYGTNGSFGVVYTFSKTMDIADNSQANGLTFAHPAYWDRNWALAGYDRKHNFQWWTVYPLPFGKGRMFLKSGVFSAILGGWQLQTVVSRVSGTPFNITANSGNLNAPGNTQLADQVVKKVRILGGHTTGHPYFDPSAFADPAVTTPGVARFGTAGRNAVRGPGFFNLDAGVKRNIAVTDRVGLQLQVETFDTTNTPQFANPSGTNVSNASSFGIITSSNANRTMRMSGRITF